MGAETGSGSCASFPAGAWQAGAITLAAELVFEVQHCVNED